MRWSRITQQIKQWGQPRPYADHIYCAEYLIEVSDDGVSWRPAQWDSSIVSKHLHAFQPWVVDGNWYEISLQRLNRLGDGKWLLETRQHYTD